MNTSISASYFRTAFRKFWRNKVFTLINIGGLAIGIFSFVLIMLFVHWELSYDKFFNKSDRIYRLGVDAIWGNTEIHQVYTPAPLPAALYEAFPQVEAVTRVLNPGAITFHIDNKVYSTDKIFLVDSSFLDIFDLQIVAGSLTNQLKEPNTLIISESAAKKYYGEDLVINKTVLAQGINFRITGIFKDIPQNTHFKYEILTSLSAIPDLAGSQAWFSNNFTCYLLLTKGSDYRNFEAQLPKFTTKYLFKGNYNDFTKQGNKWEYFLQPLSSIHLNSDLAGEFEPNGKLGYVKMFMVIGIFILLLACINFVNLSTARSAQRSKEVALRKIYGSSRKQLIFQFLGESFILTIVCFIIGMAFVETVLPLFRNYINRPVALDYFHNIYTIPFFIVLIFFTGILSGSYPAIYMSSFKPVQIYKDKLATSTNGIRFRNILVIFQCAISVFLISGTIIVTRQFYLLQNENLGFAKENIIVVKNAKYVGQRTRVFKEEINRIAGVDAVSISSALPGTDHNNVIFTPEGSDHGLSLNMAEVDKDYLKVMRFSLNKGRFFSEEFPTDSSAIIINLAALNVLEWKERFDRKLRLEISPPIEFHTIGVTEDFHYESKHQTVRPMGMILLNNTISTPNFVSVRIKPGNPMQIVKEIERLWYKMADGSPFEYNFLDESYDRLYKNEAQTRDIFTLFSLLSVFVASLGLFGLSAFLVERRTKEVGIRKAIGATTKGITLSFLLQYIKWVVLAGIIATPLAYLVMQKWLQNFAFRITLGWWIFLIAIAIAVVIAILTVLLQTIKAAAKNPTNLLRYE